MEIRKTKLFCTITEILQYVALQSTMFVDMAYFAYFCKTKNIRCYHPVHTSTSCGSATCLLRQVLKVISAVSLAFSCADHAYLLKEHNGLCD